jgi:hypothetical protein
MTAIAVIGLEVCRANPDAGDSKLTRSNNSPSPGSNSVGVESF